MRYFRLQMEAGRFLARSCATERLRERGSAGSGVALHLVPRARRGAKFNRARVLAACRVLALGGLVSCARTELAPSEYDAGLSGAAQNGGWTASSGVSAAPAGGAASSGGSGLDAGTGASSTAGAAGSGGASPIDLCRGVSCDTPPPPFCKNATTAATYSAIGHCSDGACRYETVDTACGPNQACAGAGVCSTPCKTDSRCGASCTACGGRTPKCQDLGTTSKCVECLSDADCPEALPTCSTKSNICLPPPPSCLGLAFNCGPHGGANCCAWALLDWVG